jgi:ribosome production factor 2
VTKDVLTEIHRLKRVEGDVQRLTKPNDVHPFEEASQPSLEFLCERSDAGLFCLASHSKKRPHNLTLGRVYDGRVYDLLEVGVCEYTKLQLKHAASASAANASAAGSKPCFAFLGDEFDLSAPHGALRSMLLDLFRGRVVEEVNLKALESVWVCAAPPGDRVHCHLCRVRLKKSGTRVPRVALERMGPTLELELRRHEPPSEDVRKAAMVAPRVTAKKRKNVAGDVLDGTVGKVYVPKQSVDDVVQSTHKMKGMKRRADRNQVARAIRDDTDAVDEE